MSDTERAKHDDDWSRENSGQHYGWYPALPYHAAYPDMLHMNLNQFNACTEEAFHSHLLEGAYENDVLKQLAIGVREQVNTRLKAHAENGGAGVLLTFGMPGALHVANGPKMKAVLRSPTLLLDLCELMRPLWAAAEAADDPKVRWQPLSKTEHEQAAAKAEAEATAAELTAAAGASAGAATAGAGGKAERKGKAAKNAKKASSMANLKQGRKRETGLPSAAAAANQPTSPIDANAGAEATGAGTNDDATAAETDELCAALDSQSRGLGDVLERYEERVAWMFITLQEHFLYTHQHQLSSSGIDQAYRKQRALEEHRLGLEVERAMLSVIGTKRRRTYGHDMVYGLPGLYMLLGKPYLGACEHNEHAHHEMKHFFRHMSSKSCKTRSACLQVLDMMVSKRILVDANASLLPRTKYTQMRTGLATSSGRKSCGVKCSDDTIEDAKESLAALLPEGQTYCKTDKALLDPATQAKHLKREREREANEGEGMETE